MKMNTPLRIFIVVAAVAIALTLLVYLGPYEIGGNTVSLNLRSETKDLLEKIGLPDSAENISDISASGPDGPMPEIASRSFTTDDSRSDLETFFLDRCLHASLGSAGEDRKRIEPAVLCEGPSASGTVTMLLFTDCSDGSCAVNTEVRLYPILRACKEITSHSRCPLIPSGGVA